ncbi:carboxymuconolactone decarboxylase family protein [Novosphingobium malaysiense]|uniref:Gamma-carboxymuconolactone decarboxylase n=1 Tax=Novosphingobium malaysiense TaxID=1348853 RepID=A0A0B1ZM41_9SPHN|nr:carboxymuconolactone decarboxylase family protein [Novosphingobium malaysiense]KHK90404.1 gamma-carboxymuconolactone decarboxylase [Novosphingobium malaysiense]
MALLDPVQRAEQGMTVTKAVLGSAPDSPASLLDESIRDFVFAQVWSRPALDMRSRYLIGLSGEIIAGSTALAIEDLAFGALRSEALTASELREAALQLAIYAGWPRGRALDDAVSRAMQRLNMTGGRVPPLRGEPWALDVSRAEGTVEFRDVMLMDPAPAVTPYYEKIQEFVFGEMWCRRGLDQRARRWITLVSVCDAAAEQPLKTHIHAAMATGNCTAGEMHEFALQYGTHAGWPKASLVQAVVIDMARKVEAGLAWNASI